MTDRLETYHAMRDFEATTEPAGDRPTPTPARRFTVQQHDATRLHWDLRLEHEGVLLSWALPKGFPRTPKQNHLAVHTEDHPLEYLEYEGHIPDGSYGAGNMFVWDRGTYDAEKLEDDKVVVDLHGERARGRYALFSIGKGEAAARDWLIHRMDPPEDGDWQDPPEDVRPLLDIPARFGLRVLVDARPGEVTIRTLDGDDVSTRFPELRRIGRNSGSVSVLLDGVVVGEPEVIERRLGATRADAARRLARSAPVRLALFDALWSEGRSMLDRPDADRHALLASLNLEAPAWTTLEAGR